MTDRHMYSPEGTPVVVGSETERVTLQARGYTDEPKQDKGDTDQKAQPKSK